MRTLIERLERPLHERERAGQRTDKKVAVDAVHWDTQERSWVADVSDAEIVDAEHGPIAVWPVDEDALYTALENANVAPAAIDKLLAARRPIRLPGREQITVRVAYTEIKRDGDPAYWRD